MSHRRKVTGPFFHFYAKDWLVSTAGLTFGAKGLYIDLLSVQWDQFFIPPSVDDICRILRTTRAIFDPLWAEIDAKFKLQKCGFVNRRLERERGNYRDYLDQRREAGKRSAQARRKPEQPPVEVADDFAASQAEYAQNPPSDPPAFVTPSASRAIARMDANPHHKPTNLINGASIRRHGSHAWCSPRDGLCVPQFLHEEFLGKSNKPHADLLAWYVSTIAALNGHAVGEDALVFWRNSFGQWVGVVTAAPNTHSKTARSLQALRSVLTDPKPVKAARL